MARELPNSWAYETFLQLVTLKKKKLHGHQFQSLVPENLLF